MNIGRVYMIISPSGKVYVGSTIRNFEDRWWYYINLHCKSQRHLYNSFKLYGVENHIFHKAWVGDVKNMLKTEAILGRIWNVLDRSCGLNCQLPKESDIYSCISEDTRIKMSESAKNKPAISKKTRDKMSKSIKDSFTDERRNTISSRLTGHIVSQETRDKIGKANKGNKLSDKHKLLLSNINKGKKYSLGMKHSEKTKKLMSDLKLGIKQSNDHVFKRKESNKKPIIQMDLEGNFIKEWDSGISAAKELNLSSGAICECCKGKSKRVSKFKFKYK